MAILPPRRDILLAGLGLGALGGCGSPVGSVLPEAVLPALPGLVGPNGWPVPGFEAGAFRRGVALLNVWASWCPYCQAEHDHLMRLAREGQVRMLGLVFQDSAAKAAAYLRRAGNPFEAVALDDGRLSRALGQRGVPASYVVDRSGRVTLRWPGGIDDGAIRTKLVPAFEAARVGDIG